MLFAVLVAAALVFSTFGEDRETPNSRKKPLAERQGAAMETRGDGKGMPWSPDSKPRMGPRGMEPGMGDRRHTFEGEDRFNGKHGPRGGNRFSGRQRFEGEDGFNRRHGSRGGNRFNGKRRFGGEDYFSGLMMQRPMKNLRLDK